MSINPTWFPDLGVGMGLRPAYFNEALFPRTTDAVDWFEVITENIMPAPLAGPSADIRAAVERVRRDRPIVLHGVSMSLGSIDPLRKDYLHALRELVDRYQPVWISDHLCWTGVEGINLHDLMPLPYTEATIAWVAGRIQKVQEFLGRRILVENVSSYVETARSEMTEAQFLSEVSKRADCGILLDVNNIAVSAFNHGFSSAEYLAQIPWERVGQLHLAGHVERHGMRIDTHDQPVSEEVWLLYADVLRRLPRSVSTMLERDGNFPDWPEITAELSRIRETREIPAVLKPGGLADDSAGSRRVAALL